MTVVQSGQRVHVVVGDGAEVSRTGRSEWKGRHLAHAPEWESVIRQAYGHSTLYVTAVAGGRCAGVLPAFVIRRPVLGTVVASMPFLDGGGPWAASPEIAQLLLARLIHAATDIGARSLDMRALEPLHVAWEARTHKANLTLVLPSQGEQMWTRLDGAVRNQVRKGERAGLWIDEGREHLPAFYEVYLARMRDLGSPAHAVTFFEATLRAFGDRARVMVVRKGSDTIGGLVALTSDDTVSVPWAACHRDSFALCPNMLLYWHAIRTACAGGARRFDFGRSTVGSGTFKFKRQWGAVPQPLYWYAIPLRAHRAQPRGPSLDAVIPLAAAGWRSLPDALTRRVGPILRKYLVQ